MSAERESDMSGKRNGDFTKPERDIREALFAVFYEEEWTLTYRKPARDEESEQEDTRWKFVDEVIDRLRKRARERRGEVSLDAWRASRKPLTKPKEKAAKEK